MHYTKILTNRIPYYYHEIIKNKTVKPPPSYGEYLKKEVKRDKNKRLKIIKEWYDYIYSK
jgi:hypothetical protein